MEDFNTQSNMGFLWNLMNESEIFNKIPNSMINNVKKIFEFKMNEIERTNNQDNLTELNKIILKEMMNEMDKIRNTQPITAKAFTQRREDLLNIEFEKQRADLTNQINAKKPKEINFSDNMDEPFGSEIDQILEETIKKRELELRLMPPPPPNNNNKNKNIKIGEEIAQIDSNQTISLNNTPPKRVSFQEPEQKIETNMNDFFSKLKNDNVNTNNNTEINMAQLEARFQTIEAKLDTIIELINKN